ncbi:MAG: hypothetical protein U0U69_08915 [Acidimicrobiia bacterium]
MSRPGVGIEAGTPDLVTTPNALGVTLPNMAVAGGDAAKTEVPAVSVQGYPSGVRIGADGGSLHSTLTLPARDGTYTLPAPVRFEGGASGRTGVAAVKVAVYNRNGGLWWAGGSSWGGITWHDATLSKPGSTNTTWSFVWGSALPGDYSVIAQAFDGAGNKDRDKPTARFSVRPGVIETPAVPVGLSAVTRSSPAQIALSWAAPTDGIAVGGYEVSRDGTVIASPAATSLVDSAVVPGTSYAYRVRALGTSGNQSGWSAAVSATIATGAYRPSGMDGGGFQNVVAVDPLGSGTVLAGGDVGGLYRSTDVGANWSPANAKFANTSELAIATLAYSKQVRGRVYAGSGSAGSGGGVFRSDDGGATWAKLATTPRFGGGNNPGVGGVPSPQPRSTGNLLALDETNGVMYAATFDDGVMRSLDGGLTWTTLGLGGLYLRSLALDPSKPDVVYASAYDDGVYVTTSARTAGTFSKLASSPDKVEELTFVGSTLYAAAGPSGVFKVTDTGATWTQLGASRLRLGTGGQGEASWTSIDGYVAGGGDVLFVGANRPFVSGNKAESVMRSVDGGATWEPVTTSGVSYTVAGTSEPWWLADQATFMMMDRGSYVASQISIDRSNPQRVFVSGRSGIWRSLDGGDTWQPAVRGLGATINRSVVADPNVAGRVYVANTDWVFLASGDQMAHVSQHQPPTGNIGFSLAVNRSSGVVYEAVGERDTNTNGEVYSNPDPLAGRAWVSEGLGDATGRHRPLGVAADTVDGAPVVLAAVEQSGVWRKSSGTWTRVATQPMAATQPLGRAALEWQADTQRVFLYDGQTGVWRSNDAGLTWTLIWASPTDAPSTGFLATDPTRTDRLFVSNQDGLFRLDGAADGTIADGSLQTTRLGVDHPGPIAVTRTGDLFATRLTSRTSEPALFHSTDAGTTLDDVADQSYIDAARFPAAMTASADGTLHVSLKGNGVLVVRPSSTTTTTTTTTTTPTSTTTTTTAPPPTGTPRIVGAGLVGDVLVKITWSVPLLDAYEVRVQSATGAFVALLPAAAFYAPKDGFVGIAGTGILAENGTVSFRTVQIQVKDNENWTDWMSFTVDGSTSMDGFGMLEFGDFDIDIR